MSLIEGVGDDVTVFVAVVFTIVILILAWFSTHVTDRFLVNVIVLDRATFQRLLQRLRVTGRLSLGGTTARTAANENRGEGRAQGEIEGRQTEAGTAEGEEQERGRQAGDETGRTETQQTERAETLTDTNEEHSVAAPLTATESTDSAADVGSGVQSETEPLPSSEESPESLRSRDSQTNDPSVELASTEGSLIFPENVSTDSSAGLRHRFSTSTAKSSQPTFTSVPEADVVTEAPSGGPDVSPAPETVDSSTAGSGEEPNADSISIKIRFLDDREREIQTRSGETIGEFKRRHFASELAENFSVRFVYNGQELRQDNNTLQSYNVHQNSVIHCLLSRSQTTTPGTHQQQVQEFDLSILMFPLFGLILALIWYCRFTYKNYFNAMSTFSLVGITFLFLVAIMAVWRPGVLQDREHD